MRNSRHSIPATPRANDAAVPRRKHSDLAYFAEIGILGFGPGALSAGRVAGLAVPTILIDGALLTTAIGWRLLF